MDSKMSPLRKAKEIKSKWGKKIIQWEEENGKDFSWRKHRSPYRVLVSELLLKRTTSTAAARTYNVFLSSYPDVIQLSKKHNKHLLVILKDIGLYRQRSIQIKKMAEYLVNEYGGKIPDDYSELIRVPGIGEYTASAVLVFGYGRPKAVVDSNVERVIGRAFGVKGKTLKEIAETLIPKKNADIYNYGMIDIGSKICHYKYIKCEKCPVNNYCSFMNKKIL